MAEERQSILYRLKPITDRLPAVSKPEGHVPFKHKMMWTVTILVMYFVMTNVMIYGIATERTDVFEQFRAIMAGASFSLMHLGIGPIVTGSIIMQLFVGAKIINLDLTNADDKAVYQGTQKLMVILMIFVEAIPQVYGYLQPNSTLIESYGSDWAKAIIIAQLFVGSYLVFLMDEVVSKWGIGSGVSLFIAAGVSQAIITGTINWMPVDRDSPLTVGGQNRQANLPSGTIPKTIYILQH
ncbi:MAG: preprotein translocase subunit SecY, partial [Thermoplasmata archaeon]|nr:preprotein translocase subunit SecY [Thermoplasmata archaeon]